MPHALIVGITGFTGSMLARRLVAQGWMVRGIDESEDAAPQLEDLGIEIELADVGDSDELDGLGMDGEHVFYVMRSVADTHDDMERRTIRGVANLVDAMGKAKIASFTYGSTLAVYGSGSLATLSEESPVKPNTGLGRLNVETEELLMEHYASTGFPARVVRAGTVYGPGGGTMESSLLHGRGIRLIGGGKNPTSRIHVEDAAAIFEAVAVGGRSGEVYLAVDDNPAPASEYLGYLASEAGVAGPRSSPKLIVEAMVGLYGVIARITRTKSPISESLLGLVTGSYPTSNAKVREELRVALRYPTYVEGAVTLLDSMSGDG